ncbi:SAVMC3_10250 family protein [Streptomyces atriruber]|uniref:SAVMC3_10250 family protein n=1 Tax=Streptomyces atriruber TaxID=545121 RepID=A0ABV3BNV8_9ACTN
MRYYLYVSGTKLDMLYEQIPPKLLKRIAVEAKVDLKVLSVAVQSPRADATTYDRLDIVEAYLEREFDVSWMTEPRPWFRGDLELRIAGYGSPEGPTFMTGRDGDTVIALIGSAHHLLGQRTAPETIQASYSMLPSLFRLLDDTPGRAHGQDAAHQVLDFAEALSEPPVYGEFLARRLLHGTATGRDGRQVDIVVGTPLYVAMADEDTRREA